MTEETKICKDCEIKYPKTNEFFYYTGPCKRYFHSYCKGCSNKRSNKRAIKRRQENREKAREQQAEYYQNNKEKRLQQYKEYYQRNREKRLQKQIK